MRGGGRDGGREEEGMSKGAGIEAGGRREDEGGEREEGGWRRDRSED